MIGEHLLATASPVFFNYYASAANDLQVSRRITDSSGCLLRQPPRARRLFGIRHHRLENNRISKPASSRHLEDGNQYALGHRAGMGRCRGRDMQEILPSTRIRQG